MRNCQFRNYRFLINPCNGYSYDGKERTLELARGRVQISPLTFTRGTVLVKMLHFVMVHFPCIQHNTVIIFPLYLRKLL